MSMCDAWVSAALASWVRTRRRELLRCGGPRSQSPHVPAHDRISGNRGNSDTIACLSATSATCLHSWILDETSRSRGIFGPKASSLACEARYSAVPAEQPGGRNAPRSSTRHKASAACSGAGDRKAGPFRLPVPVPDPRQRPARHRQVRRRAEVRECAARVAGLEVVAALTASRMVTADLGHHGRLAGGPAVGWRQ